MSCFVKVAEYCDYITINISSPNTPGLRNLHDDKNIIDDRELEDGEEETTPYLQDHAVNFDGRLKKNFHSIKFIF